MPEWLKNDIIKILKKFKSTFIDNISLSKTTKILTLTENTQTVSLDEYDVNKNTLLVFSDGNYLEENMDYTVLDNVITFNTELEASIESPIKLKILILSIVNM